MPRQRRCSGANVQASASRWFSAALTSVARLRTACGGAWGGAERVGLKVQFLLQDPGEDELGGDDGDRRRHGASTQVPVFFT